MEKILEIVATHSNLPQEKIKGRKRYNRQVSDAKMLFCLLAYQELPVTPCEIARFLECPHTNVYHLLKAGTNYLRYDKAFREKLEELRTMSEER